MALDYTSFGHLHVGQYSAVVKRKVKSWRADPMKCKIFLSSHPHHSVLKLVRGLGLSEGKLQRHQTHS